MKSRFPAATKGPWLGAWLAAGAAVSVAPVLAADGLPPLLEPCVSLQRDSERLACYDKAIANILMGDTSAKPVSAENMFGAHADIPRSEAERREVKREELKQISGKVTSLRHTDDGMIVLELDNGQVWRQQDSDVRLVVATGDTITIVRASLGTFKLTDKTGRFARFRRVR
jgi:hypothetical protein